MASICTLGLELSEQVCRRPPYPVVQGQGFTLGGRDNALVYSLLVTVVLSFPCQNRIWQQQGTLIACL